MKNFARMLRKTQAELKTYLESRLKSTGRQVITDDGYIFSQGNVPVLLVAHLDTVHKEIPKEIFYDDNTKTLSSPQGIGGDDRCGVYMILKVLDKFNCSVLFCEDEEIGAVGAQKFIDSEHIKGLEFNYIIEFDRKGNNDAVFYDCDNIEFEDFITKEFFKTSWGTFSDISWLAPALGCAAVNLSCGYYKAHTVNEYIVVPEMEAIIEAACKIIARTKESDKFEYIEAKNPYKSQYAYEDWYLDDFYTIVYLAKDGKKSYYDTVALSEDEAIGKFCKNHPEIPYINIFDVYHEGESNWYI